MVIQPRWHIGGNQKQLVSFGEFENSADEAAARRAHVAPHTWREAKREQQAHASLVVRWSSGVDQLIGRKAIAEQSRVANLLKSDSIKLKLRTSSNDAGKLAHEAEANIQRAEPRKVESTRGIGGEGETERFIVREERDRGRGKRGQRGLYSSISTSMMSSGFCAAAAVDAFFGLRLLFFFFCCYCSACSASTSFLLLCSCEAVVVGCC